MPIITIGRSDIISLPELEIKSIEAKIDTGAYGSALHCHHIEIMTIEDQSVLAFKMLDPSHPEYDARIFHSHDFSFKKVKSSIGETELRYTIKTQVDIFDQSYPVEFSLTDRKAMKFPVLLGRKFLKNRFIVDVRLKNLSFKSSLKNKQ